MCIALPRDRIHPCRCAGATPVDVLRGQGLRVARHGTGHPREDERARIRPLRRTRVGQAQAQHEHDIVARADGQQHVLGGVVVAAHGGHGELGAPPARSAPQQRLVELHGLDAVERDDAVRRRCQSVADAQAVLGDRHGEVREAQFRPQHADEREDAGDHREHRGHQCSRGRQDSDDDDRHDHPHHEHRCHQHRRRQQCGEDQAVERHAQQAALRTCRRRQPIRAKQRSEAAAQVVDRDGCVRLELLGRPAQQPLSERRRRCGRTGRGHLPGRDGLRACGPVRRNPARRRGAGRHSGARGLGGGAGFRTVRRPPLPARAQVAEDLVPQRLRLGPLEIGDRDVRIRPARDVEDERGEAQQTRDERQGDVDGLDAVVRGGSLLPRDDAGAQGHACSIDAEPCVPPAQPQEDHGDDQDEDDHADHRSGDERVLPDEGRQQPDHAEPPGVAALTAQALDDQVLQDGLEILEDDHDDDTQRSDQPRAALEHRSQPVDVPPPCRIIRGRPSIRTRALRRLWLILWWVILRRLVLRWRKPPGPLRRGHSPARRAPPRDAMESRSASASGRGRPGRDASVAADAVWSVIVASPAMRSSGPAETSTYCSRP